VAGWYSTMVHHPEVHSVLTVQAVPLVNWLDWQVPSMHQEPLMQLSQPVGKQDWPRAGRQRPAEQSPEQHSLSAAQVWPWTSLSAGQQVSTWHLPLEQFLSTPQAPPS